MSEVSEIIKVDKVNKPKGCIVTLCMIVKDEEAIIERCLESMTKYIDRYDITDTGSTDRTKEIIKEFFDARGIPGTVHEMEWEGFGKSRTQALKNCEGTEATYAWMIDADDFIEGEFIYPEDMVFDSYSIKIQRGEFVWYRNQLFKIDSGWRYEGVLHEYAACNKPQQEQTQGRIVGDNYHLEARTEGKRNLDITTKEKYTKDAEVLIDALENAESPHYEPNNARYQFYLGQSWFDAGEIDKALEAYEARVPLEGWEEEVFYTLYRIGICKAILEKPEMEVAKAFIDAWAYRPLRAEPLQQLAKLYRTNNKPRHAYLYAKQAAQTPYPQNDILFVESEVYSWKALDELAATAFYMFNFEEGYRACSMLADAPSGLISDGDMTRITDNWRAYEEKMKEIGEATGQSWPPPGVPTPPSKNGFTISKPNIETIEVKSEPKEKKSTKIQSKKNFKKRKKK